MKARLCAFFFVGLGLLVPMAPLYAQQPPQPCERSLTDETMISADEARINFLLKELFEAYESGDKQKEEDATKRLVGYTSHREVSFSEDEKNKMEEIAQRPEVKAIIEASYAQTRAADTTAAYRNNAYPCFFYPNPRLQNYVNTLGQSLVPKNTTEFYTFKIVNDPRQEAWVLSTGTVYITTGMVANLDNEAQLAYILAHEVGHIELRHAYLQKRDFILEELLQAEKIRSAKRKGALIGAGLGALGGAFGGGKTAAVGALGGAVVGYEVADIIMSVRGTKLTDFSTTQETAADDFAMRAVLEHNFDAREAPKIFAILETSVRHDSRIGAGFAWGNAESLGNRRQHIQTLLTGALKADLEQRSKSGLQTTSPNFALMMSEVKRDNGALALEYDLFDEARQNLEEAVAFRSTDPTAHYYLGQAYKLTARGPEDSRKAMDHFVQSIRLDTTRSAFYNPHLERALALLNQNDPAVLAEAQKEIKTYIDLYKLNHGGATPPNMYILYDYLSQSGDDNWSAPPVTNVTQTQLAPNLNRDPLRADAKKVETPKDEVKKTVPTNKDK